MAAVTHNEKVLALLSDGKPHSHREIYGLFVGGFDETGSDEPELGSAA